MNSYTVCLECTVPNEKKRWFEILFAATPEECKRSYDKMVAEHPEAKYAMAIKGRHEEYGKYVENTIKRLFCGIARKWGINDVGCQAFAVDDILHATIKTFEKNWWLLDTPIDFIDKMICWSACGWGGEADRKTKTLKWVMHNFKYYIPLPAQHHAPEGCYMLHDATPDEFYFDDNGVRFETELKCDKEGWFEVKSDPNAIFESNVERFLVSNNLPMNTKPRIFVNARKNECKIKL